MATSEGDSLLVRAATTAEDVRDRVGVGWARLGVVGVTLVALFARLYALGARTAHWDEGRVAYWILRYMETGNFEYRPIIHGPFYHHVNKYLFEIFGASDATMRLPVAVATGLLPLTALLFRDRLRGSEMVALALFLAFNPLVLYYSRFMRGDPLVAAFMFAAFALGVRTVDTGKRRYFYGAVAFVALGLTVKENALVYLVTWVGATALLLDHRLFLARLREERWATVLVGYVRTAWRKVKEWLVPLLIAPFELLAIVVFFYAPRAGSEKGPGLWKVPDQPSMFRDVVYQATVGSWKDFYGLWVSGGHQSHPYLPYLGDFVKTLLHGAPILAALAVAGFLVDRYSDASPRDTVSFAFYWGFVSVLGYPIITDIKAPWAPVNAVVPLAIPAAVGLSLLYRHARRSVRRTDAVDAVLLAVVFLGVMAVVDYFVTADVATPVGSVSPVVPLAVLGAVVLAFGYRYDLDRLYSRDLVDGGLAVVVLLLIVAQVGGAAVDKVYVNHSSGNNDLVQFAQPGSNVQPLVEKMRAAAANESSSPDVVLYGDYYVDNGAGGKWKPACAKWFNALPLPWYFEMTNVTTACAVNESALREEVQKNAPAIVIVRTPDRDPIVDELSNYRVSYYSFRAWGKNTTVFVHPRLADGEGIPASSLEPGEEDLVEDLPPNVTRAPNGTGAFDRSGARSPENATTSP